MKSVTDIIAALPGPLLKWHADRFSEQEWDAILEARERGVSVRSIWEALKAANHPGAGASVNALANGIRLYCLIKAAK
jgi:hypothetical protein